ncbi:MAG: Sec-independent protein translocase subunit TatA/TatB [Myxococcota bacterium]
MFGIGPGEMTVLLVVLLIAVGPKSMPKLMRAVGRGMREFRRATNDLRREVGIDELMRDDQWRDPLGLQKKSGGGAAGTPSRHRPVTPRDRQREYPPEGVDVRHLAEQQAPAAETGSVEAGPAAGPSEEAPR